MDIMNILKQASGKITALTASGILAGEELKVLRGACILIEGGRILDLITVQELRALCRALGENGDESCSEDVKGTADRKYIADRIEIIDLGDAFLMPGLFDCHNHLAMDAGIKGHLEMMELPREDHERLALNGLKKDILSGVTSARCMGDRYYLDIDMKSKIASGEADGPDLFVCGIGMRSVSGHGYVGLHHEGAAQFQKTAEENIKRGADHLKIFVSPGIPAASPDEEIPCYLKAEEISPVTKAGKEAGILTAAHCIGGPGLELCVKNGVKVLDHLYSVTLQQIHFLEEEFDGWVDLTSGIVMDEEREAFTPKAQNIKMRKARPYSEECLARLCQSPHLRFTLGTDAYHGKLWKEVEYAVKCGMPRKKAIKAVTVNAAEMTGCGKTGRNGIKKGQISPGYQADIIAVKENPLTTPGALSDIRFVMKNGRVSK